jgi:hypothetical protein
VAHDHGDWLCLTSKIHVPIDINDNKLKFENEKYEFLIKKYSYPVESVGFIGGNGLHVTINL